MRLPEEQRRVIAEFCGWTQIEDRSEAIMMPPGCAVVGHPPEGAIIGKKQSLPDYLNDLNAMHDAEKLLFERNDWSACKYEEMLLKETTSWAWYATAAQRAEALLMTLGECKESDYAIT